jgi:hypothetical protein
MSEATIRAQIKTVVESVAGIGAVHDYQRYSRSWAALKAMYTASGTVNSFTIYRIGCQTERDTMPTLLRHHAFRLDGIRELDDAAATEKTFQTLLDALFTAFKNNQTLSGTCQNVDPLQIDQIGVEDLEQTLYHVASCSLVCHERVLYP